MQRIDTRLFIFALVFSFMHTATIHAEVRTCAKKLKSTHAKYLTLFIMVPIGGWALGPALSSRLNEIWRDALYLDAATTIVQANATKREMARANRVIDKFYEHLIWRYQDMTMGRDEVVKVLYRFNINTANNHFCDDVANIWSNPGLENTLFPDHKAASYLQSEEIGFKARESRNNKNSPPFTLPANTRETNNSQ
jgi:hypothetical protein